MIDLGTLSSIIDLARGQAEGLFYGSYYPYIICYKITFPLIVSQAEKKIVMKLLWSDGYKAQILGASEKG
jgi:hypothetical protein